MEKKMAIFTVILTLAFSGYHAFGRKNLPPPVQSDQHTSQPIQRNPQYTWYMDAEMTDAVGSYGTINYEMDRLRSNLPAHIFTSAYYMGMYQYEWGYNPNFMTAIIWSDIH